MLRIVAYVSMMLMVVNADKGMMDDKDTMDGKCGRDGDKKMYNPDEIRGETKPI